MKNTAKGYYLHTLNFFLFFKRQKKIFTETNFQQTSLFTSSSSIWLSTSLRVFSTTFFQVLIPKQAKNQSISSILKMSGSLQCSLWPPVGTKVAPNVRPPPQQNLTLEWQWVGFIKTAKEGRRWTGVGHGRLSRRGRRVTCLSRRCPRGSRTALTAAAALSPTRAPVPQGRRHHPVAAAGTAWREMGRPWRWEGYYWACAWSGGYRGTAWNLRRRKERNKQSFNSTTVALPKPFHLTIKNQVAHLWMTVCPPKPRWEPVCGNHPLNERRTQKRAALRQSMPGLGLETLISCC